MALAVESEDLRVDGAAPPFSPGAAVAAELARAAGNAALLPLRTLPYLVYAARRRRRFEEQLAGDAAIDTPPPLAHLPGRPLRIFVGSAETSGEHHAVRLIEGLRSTLREAGAPEPELLALGGERTRALGVETVGDPAARASMGLDPLRSLPWYARLLRDTGERLARFRPDLVVPVDSPALFVPLARIARKAGLRCAHFVAPQYWAWAPWRVRAYREAFSLALTILPFEPAWFARHGVATAHVGHPALDGLAPAPPPDDPGRRNLVLLPGSRTSVVARNLPWMLATAGELARRHPDLGIVLAHSSERHAERLRADVRAAGLEDRVRLAFGDLHGELGRARAALTVSGTILVDLLHHRLPAAVVYRLDGAFSTRAARVLLTVPWFSSVNLVARAPVHWEAAFHGEGPRAACLEHLERSLGDDGFRRERIAALEAVAARLGPPGACLRAARHVLARASTPPGRS